MKEISRLAIRLTKEQKERFEHVAHLGGFKTLTELVIFSVEEQGNKREKLLKSMKRSLLPKETGKAFLKPSYLRLSPMKN